MITAIFGIIPAIAATMAVVDLGGMRYEQDEMKLRAKFAATSGFYPVFGYTMLVVIVVAACAALALYFGMFYLDFFCLYFWDCSCVRVFVCLCCLFTFVSGLSVKCLLLFVIYFFSFGFFAFCQWFVCY